MSIERTENSDGVRILQDSAVYFNDALKQYRLCHDLATTSGMMDNLALIKLDECAVAFRKLSCFGATLAEKVATVWCGTCGMFYRNLGKLNGKDPSKILKTIGGNAMDLSKGFKYLADSSDNLATSFKSLGPAMPAIQDVFVRAFEQEEKQAEMVEAEKQRQLEDAKEKSAAAKEEIRNTKGSWLGSSISRGLAVLSYRASNGDAAEPRVDRKAAEVERKMAEQELESAKKLEEKLEKEVKEAQAKLKEQTDHRRRAEVFAGELTKLMRMLREVSGVCRYVGEYFHGKAEEFQNFSEVKTGEELATEKGLTEWKATAEAEKLAQQRTLLEMYHKSMAVINASYNFTPSGLQPSRERMLTGIKLDVLGIALMD